MKSVDVTTILHLIFSQNDLKTVFDTGFRKFLQSAEMRSTMFGLSLGGSPQRTMIHVFLHQMPFLMQPSHFLSGLGTDTNVALDDWVEAVLGGVAFDLAACCPNTLLFPKATSTSFFFKTLRKSLEF